MSDQDGIGHSKKFGEMFELYQFSKSLARVISVSITGLSALIYILRMSFMGWQKTLVHLEHRRAKRSYPVYLPCLWVRMFASPTFSLSGHRDLLLDGDSISPGS